MKRRASQQHQPNNDNDNNSNNNNNDNSITRIATQQYSLPLTIPSKTSSTRIKEGKSRLRDWASSSQDSSKIHERDHYRIHVKEQ